MDLNSIKEIGIIYNAKIQDTRNNQLEKRNLLIFIFTDDSAHYLDIDAGRELLEYEKVIANANTKVNKIYTNKDVKLAEFQTSHPHLDIKLEDGVLKVNKKK